MRIWDVPAGYLNRQSLLGEHRELHGLVSILVHGKTGYARHPETMRWVGCLAGLARRHAWLVAEMQLRGYRDRTPFARHRQATRWPAVFVTTPWQQFELLRTKYSGREPGRIALPRAPQDLWAQHKYSVMARDPATYRTLGRRVAGLRGTAALEGLAIECVEILRRRPSRGHLVTALEHLWGHVRKQATADERRAALESPPRMLHTTVTLALRSHEPYLLASTALSDLAVFVDIVSIDPGPDCRSVATRSLRVVPRRAGADRD